MGIARREGNEMSNQRAFPDDPAPPGADPGSDPSVSRRAVLGGSVALLASLAGCTSGDAVVVGKRDESTTTHDLSSGTVRVDAESGDVTVRPGDSDGVQVTTTKSGSIFASLDATTVSTRLEDDTVVVETTIEPAGWFSPHPDVDVDVDVPPGVAVESVAVENGDAVVDGASVQSGATVESRNGDAVARNVKGDVSAETENGDATAESVDGFAAARSENGDAVVRACAGVDGVRTENGDATAEVTALRGDATVRSGNGDVDAALAPDLDARVIAETGNGDVELTDALLSPETETEEYVEGTIGDGTHELRLTTGNGDVTVSRL